MIDLEYRAGTVVVHIRVVPNGKLTAGLLDGLSAAVSYIGPAHPIVLTGAGTVFVPDLDPVDGPGRTAALEALPRVLDAIRRHPLPVVAAINGDAIGAGYTLAEAADVRVMSGGVVQPCSQRAVRYRARAAVAAGLVEHHCDPAELMSAALRQTAAVRTPAPLAG